MWGAFGAISVRRPASAREGLGVARVSHGMGDTSYDVRGYTTTPHVEDGWWGSLRR
jgi:hypothetical protein